MHAEIPRIRARRILDHGEALSLTYLTPDGQRQWWERWNEAAHPAILMSGRPRPGEVRIERAPDFYWNGVPLTTADFRARLSNHLGSGLYT